MTTADSRRIRLAANGVIASYIHDISARTPVTSERARRRGRRREIQRAPVTFARRQESYR
jgi:hypothetical protein